ncbi:hypothetical protein QX249_11360 [Vibrio parahaemolyticus]|uniref:Uncharacterized protein n=1 Tax=Vibrio parahaemolyticus TaxID=670 RepID=A0AAW8PYC3_VIBPH|nr:hypothetical protein [Vibrio parahaemolyticus]MDS1821262.1 hypothetical protein [Vibrio parahaemolyticus]
MGLISPKKLKGFLRSDKSPEQGEGYMPESVEINSDDLLELLIELRYEANSRLMKKLAIMTGLSPFLIPVIVTANAYINDEPYLHQYSGTQQEILLIKFAVIFITFISASAFFLYKSIKKKNNQHKHMAVKHIDQLKSCRLNLKKEADEEGESTDQTELLRLEQKIIKSNQNPKSLSLTDSDMLNIVKLITLPTILNKPSSTDKKDSEQNNL